MTIPMHSCDTGTNISPYPDTSSIVLRRRILGYMYMEKNAFKSRNIVTTPGAIRTEHFRYKEARCPSLVPFF
jgi:hypothetical protein